MSAADTYTVLGGNETSEFRAREDGTIELYSHEEKRETGETYGTIGTLSEDELRAVGEALSDIGEDGVYAPEMENLVLRQHTLFGVLLFFPKDEDGEPDMERGAVFSDPDTIVEAANALDN